MIVVTVARKPLAGTVADTVIKHGTGAIHVDACRVGVSGGSNQPSGMDRYNAANADRGYRPGTYQKGEPPAPLPSGRWPANLVLQHLDGCVQEGVNQVRGTPGGSISGSSAFGQKVGWNAHNNRATQITRTTTETVAVWNCAPGCPVADLDDQSLAGGMHSAGAARNKVIDTNPYASSSYEIRGEHNMRRLGDEGGASRFFKQVGGSDDPR